MKLLIAAILCLVSVSATFSQTYYIKAGVNFSSLDYSVNGVTISSNSLTDFHLGAAVATEVANKLVFQFGASYSRLATEPFATSGFAQLSAVIKYHPLKSFDFFVGPYAALQITKGDSPAGDYGITPGVEYFFNNNLGIGASYLFGLAEATATKGKIRAFQISLFFRFNSLQLKNAGY
jgi:Putative MetA-pathway of phenol degradation